MPSAALCDQFPRQRPYRAISLRDVTLVETPEELNAALAEIDRLAAFYRDAATALDAIFAADPTIPAEEKALLQAIKVVEARTRRWPDR